MYYYLLINRYHKKVLNLKLSIKNSHKLLLNNNNYHAQYASIKFQLNLKAEFYHANTHFILIVLIHGYQRKQHALFVEQIYYFDKH